MARTPIRRSKLAAPIVDGPAAEIGHNRGPAIGNYPGKKHSRLRKNMGAKSELDIPQEIIDRLRYDYNADLQWVVTSVLGEPKPAMRQIFEQNGWEPVSQDMFDGVFDGIWMETGKKGEIEFGGLVLMMRLYDLRQESIDEMRSLRLGALQAQERMVKGGTVIQGLKDGFEPVHRTVHNEFKRTTVIG